MSFRNLKSFVVAIFFCFTLESFAMEDEEVIAFTDFIQTIINTTNGMNHGVVCSVGSDEISKALSEKNAKFIDLDKDPKKSQSCKVIYVAHGQERYLRSEISKFNKDKILTIGIFDGFSEAGGYVLVQMGRRNFELTLNSKTVKETGIRLSPLAMDLVIN